MARFKPLPPLEELNRLFELRDGVLYWKIHISSRAPKGSFAGTVHKTGYVFIGYNKKLYLAHRIAYFMSTGIDPGPLTIDHINGERADNRLDNLRLATHEENSRNRNGTQSNNTSGVRGVFWDAKMRKWKAQVRASGKLKSIGHFSTIQEAESAVIKARAELFGEFAGCST
jgi:hypothetical protein